MNAAPLSFVLPPMSAHARRVLGMLASVCLLGVGLWLAADQTARPVARLSVGGIGERVGVLDVHRVLADHLQGPINALNLSALRAEVLALPWVAEARIERVWPDGLHVEVRERTPMARWGSEALLDTEGRVFVPRPSEVPQGLPQLDGPIDAAQEVMQRYLGVAEALATHGLELTGLSLDVRGEWVGRIAPGVPVRFGRNDPLERLAVLTGPVRRVTAGRLAEVERVDLRYTNGFAVRWRTANPPQGE